MLQQLERRLLRFLLIRARRQGGPSAAEQLELMSRRDPLSGLLNRVAFLDEVRRVRAAGTTGTLMLIDIDHFKLVNDKYGHAAGDEVIRAMADRIKATLPSNSVIARHGGDELIAFVPVPLERGAELAGRCVAAARMPIALVFFCRTPLLQFVWLDLNAPKRGQTFGSIPRSENREDTTN